MTGQARSTKADCNSDDGGALVHVGTHGRGAVETAHVPFGFAPVRSPSSAPQSARAPSGAAMRSTILKRLVIALAGLLLSPLALASTPVNINTADAATLAQSLDGVGMAKAQAIVAWREANGAFESADQLTEVKGIGAALVDRNRDAIQLDGGKPAKKAKSQRKPKGNEED